MACTLLVRSLAVLYTMDFDPLGGLGKILAVSVGFSGDRVCFIGPDDDAPAAAAVVDGSGWIALPSLVDAHTHIVWAGNRAAEFQRRLAGESYSAILEAGGGILSTVRATRAASDDELRAMAVDRLLFERVRGVSLVEIKSGYGLDPFHEARLLRIAREAGIEADVDVRTTYLGAHAIPAEFRSDREGYVRQVIDEQLPAVRPWADMIDVYIDRGAFTVEEGAQILLAGRALGLGLRVHAEQVTFTGAARMAAELGAWSADHLERLDDEGAEAMGRNRTVAVLLPGAMLCLKDAPPPIHRLRQFGVPMAVATDWNPGSSPVGDLWLCASLACYTMGLTVEEALLGITRHAAAAVGVPERGRVFIGGPAELALFKPGAGETTDAASLLHRLGGRQCVGRVRAGRWVPQA